MAEPAPVRVILSAAILRLFPEAERVCELRADDVAGLMAALDARWPGIADRLCDSRPAIRRHINVFVAGERATLATPLPPGAEVCILTAVSGG